MEFILAQVLVDGVGDGEVNWGGRGALVVTWGVLLGLGGGGLGGGGELVLYCNGGNVKFD